MDSGIAECAVSDACPHSEPVNELTKHISSVGLNEDAQVESESATNVSPKTSDYDVKGSRWLTVRDSLEGISPQSRESRFTAAPKGEKYIESKSPLSDSVLVFKKPTSHINFSKIFMWDPWNKIGRKSKKEKMRKKNEERAMKMEHRNRSEGPSPILRKTSAIEKEDDELLTMNLLEQNLQLSPNENSYSEKFHKSVRFQKEVNVVYFAGDQILEQKTEPLKKETEQQERNKELRREVNAETVSGIKFVLRKSQSDYSPTWSKK